jgi:hypothetical protein
MAGPYSDDIYERYAQHLAAAATLTRSGLTIYAPIVHYHHMAQSYDMPTDAIFWEPHNMNMIYSAKGIILLMLPGWSNSKGVNGELKRAKEKSLPIWGTNPLDEGFIWKPDSLSVQFIWIKMY